MVGEGELAGVLGDGLAEGGTEEVTIGVVGLGFEVTVGMDAEVVGIEVVGTVAGVVGVELLEHPASSRLAKTRTKIGKRNHFPVSLDMLDSFSNYLFLRAILPEDKE